MLRHLQNKQTHNWRKRERKRVGLESGHGRRRAAARRQSGRFSTSASRSGGSGGQMNSRADLLYRLEVREGVEEGERNS